jgi:hypothetical protein
VPASDTAWPFLIGRARDEDYRLVVLPEILADPYSSAALQAGAGGKPDGPGSAHVRELRVTPGEPVTAVYQVRAVRAQDYGITGEGLLKDAYGRPVLMTEGLILRCPASCVMAAGVSAAALDQVHELVVPAFREFWERGSDFTRQVSRPFAMPPAGARHQRLHLKPAGPATSAQPLQLSPPTLDETTRGNRGRPLAIAAFALGAVALAALVLTGLILLLSNSPSRPHPGPTATAGTHSSPRPSPSGHSLTPSQPARDRGVRILPGRIFAS